MRRAIAAIGAVAVVLSLYITIASNFFATQPNRVPLLATIGVATVLGAVGVYLAWTGHKVGAWLLLVVGVLGLLAWPYQAAGAAFVAASGLAFFSSAGTRTSDTLNG